MRLLPQERDAETPAGSSPDPRGPDPGPGAEAGPPPLRAVTALGINTGAALDSLRGNWFRSFLTMLGIVIGVASVIVLIAFGQGAREEITAQIDTLGTNVAVVVPGKLQGQKNFNPMGGMGLTNLNEGDLEALRGVRGLRAVAPLAFLGGGVYRGERPASLCMPIATTPSFSAVRRLKMERGRFLRDEDMDRPVCVVGAGIRKDLFSEEDPLGQAITVNDRAYEVIGAVDSRSLGSGLFGGEELDAIIYLPLAFVQRAAGTKMLHRVFVEVEPGANPDHVMEEVRRALLRAHGNRDDFSLLRARELLSMFFKIFTLLAALLLGITSISLVVGGIGIMNMMLVTVTERTREIGIRKTVGARRRDIFFQFLTEAVVLSSLGGLIGILLATVACRVVTRWLPLKPVMTTEAVLLGFGVCVAVGIISGVVPAVIAARKDPIEAIRHE